jgi:hypothetical protein
VTTRKQANDLEILDHSIVGLNDLGARMTYSPRLNLAVPWMTRRLCKRVLQVVGQGEGSGELNKQTKTFPDRA